MPNIERMFKTESAQLGKLRKRQTELQAKPEEAAGCSKSEGLPGYLCPPNAKIMLDAGGARRWARSE